MSVTTNEELSRQQLVMPRDNEPLAHAPTPKHGPPAAPHVRCPTDPSGAARCQPACGAQACRRSDDSPAVRACVGGHARSVVLSDVRGRGRLRAAATRAPFLLLACRRRACLLFSEHRLETDRVQLDTPAASRAPDGPVTAPMHTRHFHLVRLLPPQECPRTWEIGAGWMAWCEPHRPGTQLCSSTWRTKVLLVRDSWLVSWIVRRR
jgi:hypothetical protein